MAESQLECMDDNHVNQKIPETKPEFYYSEEQRVALEALLLKGDGDFKTRLAEYNTKDFLSARELKAICSTTVKYITSEEEEEENEAKKKEKKEQKDQQAQARSADSASLRSTYWPEKSDTDVPVLDIGWPNSGFFKGVTRVEVHTHPPKENGPHIKQVVRTLIQKASKVIAIVMDLLTDLHVLQDLLDAASTRRVPVYIILDIQGVPHFLDMCNRLQIGSQHLQNIRARTVKGVGFDMSFGRIPGSLSTKYMLVDGEKVMFGTYSFSWSSSRMDRNMITVMSGQVVEFYDNDFRELYAISDKLDLFKEFHVGKPSTGNLSRVTITKRPTMPVTSRFQVSLGDAGTLKVPAHKYHNPKYLLALGNLPGPSGSLPDLSGKMQTKASPEELASGDSSKQSGSDKLDTVKRATPGSKEKGTWRNIFSKKQRPSQKLKTKDGAAAEGEEGTPSSSTSNKLAMPNKNEGLTNIVPEHKYHNPKYLLALGNLPGPSGSQPDLSGKTEAEASSEKVVSDVSPKRGLFGRKQTSQKSKTKKKDGEAAEGEGGTSQSPTSNKPGTSSRNKSLTNIPEEAPVENTPPNKGQSKKKKSVSRQTSQVGLFGAWSKLCLVLHWSSELMLNQAAANGPQTNVLSPEEPDGTVRKFNLVPHGSQDLKISRSALHKAGRGYKKNQHPETELQHSGQDHTVV
ncbi:hypothetical protein NFI96_012957 [Prochilodus magdalenae]|nr:hypothetical protein NFI96_012957 [Prochilodus magdalenae]